MFAMYFVAFIDRVNVGFAKDAMAIDIALSQSAFALGAGIFLPPMRCSASRPTC